MKRLLFLFLSFILLLGCTGGNQNEKAQIVFKPGNVSITAEKADTAAKMEKGLMFRTSLGEKEGMIFYFNYTAYHAFWMLNTKIPLEAIFVDENFTVVDIVEMEPCNDTGTPSRMPNCTIYLPKWPALYGIEVNRNFSKKYGIMEGDRIEVR